MKLLAFGCFNSPVSNAVPMLFHADTTGNIFERFQVWILVVVSSLAVVTFDSVQNFDDYYYHFKDSTSSQLNSSKYPDP